jgi:hypothetical protein
MRLIQRDNLNTLNGTDPLSQNFFVDAGKYPNGVFLSSVDLYFASADTTSPVNVRIRPTVNGYPDTSNDIPGSIVYKKPNEVNVPTVENQTKSIGPSTNFKFDFPVYLEPGQYSLIIASDSSDYTVYTSKLGDFEFGTTKIINQLNYTASFFKSQNASTWVAVPGETLTFKLNICSFAGGTATFDVTSTVPEASVTNPNSSAVYYDLIKLLTQDLTFNSLSSVKYDVVTKDAATSSTSTTSNVLDNQNTQLTTRKIMAAASDIIIRPTITNTDIYTSPVIDLERLNTVLVKNNITPYNSANTAVESLGGVRNVGGASARYITRRVTLNNDFEATGITVYLDVNRPPGTSIEVYYKVLNQKDANNFDNNPYVLMNPKFTIGGSLQTTGPTDWTTDTYQALDITYNDITSGTLYTNFNTFAIKVVMYSSNPALVPSIKNFRAIATA